jgi:predicted dehydrogenase
MKQILVIGAGQLGSRHLQGLVKYCGKINIFVLDPSIESLKIAQEREKEVVHNHKVMYTHSWGILPDFFDLVIVATNSNIRELVIFELLEKHKVRYLILEKVLFQELEAYQRVKIILAKHNVITYVNHPRRMFESYLDLKTKLDSESQSVYSVVGGNWGIGCNALHFLDVFIFLSGKKLQNISVHFLENELLESTRKGFVEFSGSLTGNLKDGSFFSITSIKEKASPITVTVFNNEQRFVIQEGGSPQIYELERNNLFNCKNYVFKIQHQSELTTNIVKELFENGFCSLPTYEESTHTHEIFLKAMLEKYNQITKLKSKYLPIT